VFTLKNKNKIRKGYSIITNIITIVKVENMKTILNEVKKEVLNYDKKALQVLHGLYGYDFQKEYNLYKHEGKFTINSLVKKYDLDLINNKVVLLIKSGARYSMDCIYLVEVISDKKINIDFRIFDSGVDDNKLSTFYAKHQFEDARKNDNTLIYIVSQNKNNLGEKFSKPALDYSKRYTLNSVNSCCNKNFSYKDYENKVIDSIYIVDSTIKNNYYNQIEYKYNYYSMRSNIIGLHNAIDKSGYIVSKKRENLKIDAKILKTKRDKEKFLAGDYSKKMESIDNITNELKGKIVKVFNNNDLSYELMLKMDYKIMSDIKWLLHDITIFKNGINKKEFLSIDVVDNSYKKILDKYKEISKILTDLI
jgi:hypothetical protein